MFSSARTHPLYSRSQDIRGSRGIGVACPRAVFRRLGFSQRHSSGWQNSNAELPCTKFRRSHGTYNILSRFCYYKKYIASIAGIIGNATICDISRFAEKLCAYMAGQFADDIYVNLDTAHSSKLMLSPSKQKP